MTRETNRASLAVNGLLWGLFIVLGAVAFADVWLQNPPPYVFDPAKTNLSYFDWLAEQRALRWFWAGRPVWDAPVWLRILWMAGAAVALLWRRPTVWVRDRLRAHAGPPAASVDSIKDQPSGGRRRREPLWVILAVAAATLWAFRSQDLRYGDSDFLTRLIPREVKSVGANIAYEEILDCALHCRAFHYLNLLFGLTIIEVFNLLGIAATLVGLAIVWPRWRRRAGLPAGLVLLIWFTSGWSHVFFGHVEYYTSVAVVLMIYAVLAIDHIERDDGPPFWVCSFVAGLAVCFHMLAGWIWPTMGVLLWHDWRARGRSPIRQLALGGLTFLLPIAASVGIATLYGFPPTAFGNTHLAHMKFIFLLTRDNALESHRAIYQYPFLSFPHIRDAVNELIRVAWPGIVLVLGLAVAARHRQIWCRPTVLFWIVAVVFLQIFTLVWNPDLGYIRDWDLFAVVALGWTGLGIECLRQLNREEAAQGETVEPNGGADVSWLVARVLAFVVATALPMRIFQMLHHSAWVGPVNAAGMF